MLLPVGACQVCVTNGISGMVHPVISHIQPHMGDIGSSVTVSAQVGLGSYIRFTIADPKEGETLPYVNLSFENQNMEDGKVYISRMSDGVFSGTFEGGRITEGRFDLKYKE